MIEVEKKFVFDEGSAKRITEGAEFLGEETFTDTYYDTADCTLIKNNIWFRSRDDKFELKVFIEGATDRSIDRQEEIEDEMKIREKLDLPLQGTMTEILKNADYSAFCICTTVRKKYRKEGFTIVFDSAEFDDGFSPKIGQVELMMNNESEMKDASDKIAMFALAHNLVSPERGKIREYLKEKRPTYYQAFKNMIALKQ